MDYSLPGSSIHGILQVRILEWVAISFSRASSQPRDRTQVSHIAGRRFYHLSHQESPIYHYTCLKQIPGNLTTESHTWFFVFFFSFDTFHPILHSLQEQKMEFLERTRAEGELKFK